MKKIDTSNIVENTRRQPFTKASYDHLQQAFQEVFTDILKGLTSDAAGVVVLHGCLDADPDADDYDISAGALLYQGEVFQIDAFVGSDAVQVPVLSIETTYHANDPVKFTDNNDFNVHEIRKMAWTMGASGSGIADFDELVSFKERIADYEDANIAPLNDWVAAGGSMKLRRWGKVHCLSGAIAPGDATSIIFMNTSFFPAGFKSPFAGSAIGKRPDGPSCQMDYNSGNFSAYQNEGLVKPAGTNSDYYNFNFTWISV